MSHFLATGKTHDYRGRYLLHTDASEQNQQSASYVWGDAFMDDSVSVVRGADPLNVRFASKVDGVDNNTGFESSGATWHIDYQLRVGSAGDWIRLTSSDGSLQALLPHHEYTDEFGSEPFPHDPNVSPLDVRGIEQPDFSVDSLSGSHTWVDDAATSQVLLKSMFFKVGETPATDIVTVSFYKGVDDTGDLLFTWDYPISDFSASPESVVTNDGGDALFTSVGHTLSVDDEADHALFSEETYNGSYTVTFVSGDTYKVGLSYVSDDSGLLAVDVKIDFDGMSSIFPGDTIYHEIVSDTAFSLLGDASGDPWHAHSEYEVTEENIMTFESGLTYVATDESGQVVADEAGDLVYG